MKRNIFLLIFAALVASLAFTACEEDTMGELFDVEDKIHAAFASTVQKIEMVPADGNKIMVPVYRGGRSDVPASVSVSLTVPATVPAGTFTLSNPQVQFAAGESVAYAVITYEDINKLGVGVTYLLTLNLTDEAQVSAAKVNQIRVQAARKLTYTLVKKDATFTSEFYEASWKVDVYKAQEADVYRIPDLWETGFPFIFIVEADNKISFGTQPIGYVDSTYGMISFTMTLPTSQYQPYKEGNEFYLWGRFVVSAGSYGTYIEILDLN
jgi:hypothetical protein